MEMIAQDIRFAVRGLLRKPAMAVIAIGMLGLGIGANTALFSVLNGVVFRSLPFPEPDAVVHLAWQRGPYARSTVPLYKFEYWRQATTSFSGMTTWTGFSGRLGEGERLAGVSGLRVSDDFFNVVGIDPVIGRAFAPSDNIQGAADVAIVSHEFWNGRLSADPEVVGSEVLVDGRPRTIVGVMPAGFLFPQAFGSVSMITPLRQRADPLDEGENYGVLARIAPGVSKEQAESDVRRVSTAFEEEHPDLMHETDMWMRLSTFEELYVGGLGSTLWILMGATALVLLIACANVASLLMARAAERREELSLRTALGASRGRILAQLTVESALLTILAGSFGVVLARWGVDALLGLAPIQLPRADEIGIDWTVLAATFGVVVITAALFGVAAASLIPKGKAHQASRGATSGSWSRPTRHLLIASEAALAMVLLVGAGLLVATLREIARVDAGFVTEGVVTARFPLQPDGYHTAHQAWELQEDVLERVRRDGSVSHAAAVSSLPLERGWNLPMALAADVESFAGDVEWRAVSTGYFKALEIPVLRGRSFLDSDVRESDQVVMINEAFAALHFPDSDPVGQQILVGHYNGRWIAPDFESPGATIIGVVADLREMSLKSAPKRTMWVPQAQAQDMLAAGVPTFLVRGGDSRAVTNALRQAFAEADPGLPIPTFGRLSDVVGRSVAEERFNATLMGLFALLALALATVGIYGVVSYGVRQRTREVGIRIALGAEPSEVVRMLTRQGLTPVVVGIVTGGALGLYLARYLSDLVWGVSPTSPANVSMVAMVMFVVATLAAWLPARSASSGEPTRALSGE